LVYCHQVFFFRVSYSTDLNNNNDNNDSDSNSQYAWKKDDSVSPARALSSPEQWTPMNRFRRSTSNQDTSIFDFDEDVNIQPTRIICKRTSIEKKRLQMLNQLEYHLKILILKRKRLQMLNQLEHHLKILHLKKKTTSDVEPTGTPSKKYFI